MTSNSNFAVSETTMASAALETTESPMNATDEEFDECQEADNDIDVMSKIMFFYAIVIIFALGFVVRRKTLCLKCCWGRPGAVQPVDFIDEVGRRWAFGACFVVITYDVTNLFLGDAFWDIVHAEDREWMRKFGWVKVFTKLLDALSICLVYYPLLACIDHRRNIAANILGFTHIMPWIIFYCIYFHYCPVSSQAGNAVFLFVFRVPIFIAYFIVGFSFVLDFGINIHRWRQRRQAKVKEKELELVTEPNRTWKIAHHFDYVANLLRKSDNEDIEEGKGLKVKLMKVAGRVKYEKVFGFRYSTRLICVVTICTTVLIWFLVLAIGVINSLLGSLYDLCSVLKTVLDDGNNDPHSIQAQINTVCEGMWVTKIVAHFASALSALLIFIMLIHTLITYKRRWHQLLQGDHSWHMYGTTIQTPHATLLNGLKFAGYQVAFLIWGYVILTLFVFVILMFVSFAFIIPIRDRFINWLIQKLIDLWPTLLLGVIIIPLVQKLICKFLFLQEKGNVMALTNRRVYNAASYYFLVLNIIVGIFSCLKRILIPLILGVAFMSRLDQPLIMKGFETKDPGYVSFVSMLLVDLYHNHPVVKAFVELMIQVRNDREANEDSSDAESVALREKSLRSKRIRNRWMKTVTLINNPSLVLKALERRLIEERNQRAKPTPQEITKNEQTWKDETDSLEKDNSAHTNDEETISIQKGELSSNHDDNSEYKEPRPADNSVC